MVESIFSGRVAGRTDKEDKGEKRLIIGKDVCTSLGGVCNCPQEARGERCTRLRLHYCYYHFFSLYYSGAPMLLDSCS